MECTVWGLDRRIVIVEADHGTLGTLYSWTIAGTMVDRR